MTETLVKLFLSLLSKPFYRIKVVGKENIPKAGPVLLVSNHVSFIDAILIGLASPRPIRFLMFKTYYEVPVFNRLFKAMGVIPISGNDSPKALMESLNRARQALVDGTAVCIFAEGEISRHGQMLRFKKGFERIIDGLDVPVIPVHLDHVWGSVFSFEGGGVFFKRPRHMPYPLTVSFGTPRPSTSSAADIRQAIMDLGSTVFHHRLENALPLPLAFAREASRHPFRLALADSTGLSLTFVGAFARSWILGRSLSKSLEGRQAAGVFLPPTVASALVNLGLPLSGVMPVNLNYTLPAEVVAACMVKASIDRYVTSKRFVKILGWQPEGTAIYIEDELAKISTADAALAAMALLLLPWNFFSRRFLSKAAGDIDRLATILFTSGSTGIPKGVMLTHANILSNLNAVCQLFTMGPKDRLLGVLPFYHAFGYTCTLWLPLLSGMGAVYHYNPLEAQKIGELALQYQPSYLLATPTLLLQYLRRIPPENFACLRVVMAGAEKLRDSVAQAFEQRFGVLPLEGYGCTELSPVAAVNIPDISWPGVRQKGGKQGSIGHPLPGVTLRIVDPDSGEPLPPGSPGLLLVRGPNVMKGYLGDPERTNAVLRNGYYETGDIAVLDEDGFVTISDRLSRFSKIAGEMVPHVMIEERLHAVAQKTDQTFAVSSVSDPRRGEKLVVLCKGVFDASDLRRKLIEAGIPRLWLPDPDDFHKVDGFPQTGIGKLDQLAIRTLARKLSGQA